MGLLRLLLALSVVLYHAGLIGGYNIANQIIAVNAFFVISGFYMSLVLSTKYNFPNSYSLFVSNRLLRIYPIYWLVLLMTFAFVLGKYFFMSGESDNAIAHYLAHAPHASQIEYLHSIFNYIIRNLTLMVTTDYFLLN